MLSILLIPLVLGPVQTTWHVDAAAVAPGAGTVGAPYTRVDYAVAQAATVSGDTVLVRPGTYAGERIDLGGKDLTIRSTGGASQTILAADNSSVGVDSTILTVQSGEFAPVLQGFTLHVHGGTFGLGTLTGFGAGGGVVVRNSGLTLRNCTFEEPTSFLGAPDGFAVYCDAGDVKLENCTITGPGDPMGTAVYALNSSLRFENTNISSVESYRGAVYATNSQVDLITCHVTGFAASEQGAALALTGCNTFIENCSFSGGSLNFVGTFALRGGAIAAQGGALNVIDSAFSQNWARDGGGHIYTSAVTTVNRSTFAVSGVHPLSSNTMGGAIFSEGPLTVLDSRFENGTAISGGAILHTGQVGLIRNTTFQGNRARGVSSGGFGPVAFGGALSVGSGMTVERCQFVGNRADASAIASGGAISGSPTIVHCSFSGNSSSHDYGACSGGTIDSCAFASNLSAGSPLGSIGPSAQVSYSVVEGGFVGTGNLDGDPMFWGSDDLHLLPQSPAHNAGNPMSTLDPDGTRADAGALPFDADWCGTRCSGPIGFVSCTGFPHSTGSVAHLSALGSTDVALDRVVLNAAPIPTNMFGYFLGARSPGSIPFFGGSQGVLCLGGAIDRFNSSILDSGNQASFSFRPRLNQFPQGQVVTAGERWYFQAWFRDSDAGLGQSNTSSAVAIDF